MRHIPAVFTVLGVLVALPVLAQDAPAQQPACPAATAWNQAHPEDTDTALARRDAARTFSDPGLRAELAERFDRDQVARNAVLASPNNGALRRRVMDIDADDVRWLDRLVRRQGFPTAAQVGERGVRNAWLLAQHADMQPAFQASLLPALEQRHADGELDGMTLSRYTDRVLKAQGQPQRYGSQFSEVEWASGQFNFPDAERLRVIDANRQALGIMPLKDYVCMMSAGGRGKGKP